VPNSHDDAARVVENIIEKHLDQISHITVTLDTHDNNDIGFPHFWRRDSHMHRYYDAFQASKGRPKRYFTAIDPDVNNHPAHPAFFSKIRYMKWDHDSMIGELDLRPTMAFVGTPPGGGPDDIEFWTPGDPGLRKYCEEYFQSLQSKDMGYNHMEHTIWPYHCLQGSNGHNLIAKYSEAIVKWSMKTGKDPKYVLKGTNRLCEMYSAFRAEVPVKGDSQTFCNVELIHYLRTTATEENSLGLVIAGQALGQSVRFSVEDLVRFFTVASMEQVEDMVRTRTLSDFADLYEL
jgi:nicotinamidase-related amidase